MHAFRGHPTLSWVTYFSPLRLRAPKSSLRIRGSGCCADMSVLLLDAGIELHNSLSHVEVPIFLEQLVILYVVDDEPLSDEAHDVLQLHALENCLGQ